MGLVRCDIFVHGATSAAGQFTHLFRVAYALYRSTMGKRAIHFDPTYSNRVSVTGEVRMLTEEDFVEAFGSAVVSRGRDNVFVTFPESDVTKACELTQLKGFTIEVVPQGFANLDRIRFRSSEKLCSSYDVKASILAFLGESEFQTVTESNGQCVIGLSSREEGMRIMNAKLTCTCTKAHPLKIWFDSNNSSALKTNAVTLVGIDAEAARSIFDGIASAHNTDEGVVVKFTTIGRATEALERNGEVVNGRTLVVERRGGKNRDLEGKSAPKVVKRKEVTDDNVEMTDNCNHLIMKIKDCDAVSREDVKMFLGGSDMALQWRSRGSTILASFPRNSDAVRAFSKNGETLKGMKVELIPGGRVLLDEIRFGVVQGKKRGYCKMSDARAAIKEFVGEDFEERQVAVIGTEEQFIVQVPNAVELINADLKCTCGKEHRLQYSLEKLGGEKHSKKRKMH